MKINYERAREWFLYWAVVGFGTFILFFIVSSALIGFDVKDNCVLAQGRYGGDLPAGRQDCVEALSAHLEDEGAPYSERNSAIWSLGQLGDSRALPVLKKYYTGEIPDHEPWGGTISQYELKKAIKLAEGGFNATHLVWSYDSN